MADSETTDDERQTQRSRDDGTPAEGTDAARAVRAVGYEPDQLTDPGHLTREGAETGDWRVVEWTAKGVYLYDVTAVEDSERAPGDGVVVYSDDHRQPIGFADESGPLNDALLDGERMQTVHNAAARWLVPVDAERTAPTYDRPEAVWVLGRYGSDGWVMRLTAEAVTDAFDTETPDTFDADPDADGVELSRSLYVLRKLVGAVGLDWEPADSGITGHTKTRMQEWRRNYPTLVGYVDSADD